MFVLAFVGFWHEGRRSQGLHVGARARGAAPSHVSALMSAVLISLVFMDFFALLFSFLRRLGLAPRSACWARSAL